MILRYATFQQTAHNDGDAPYDNSCVSHQRFHMCEWRVQVSFAFDGCRGNILGLSSAV